MNALQTQLPRETIFNPGAANHFMRVRSVARHARGCRDGVLLTKASDAIEVIEVGRDLYEPADYPDQVTIEEAGQWTS